MDKYSKALSNMFRFVWGMFCILLGLALFGIAIWGSLTISEAFSMILIIAVLGGGFIINYGVGFAFLGDEYKRSNYVRNGETMREVVETPQLLKRRMWVTFLGSVAYVALTIFYIVRVVIFAKLGVVNGIMIGCAVVSLIMAVVFFLFAASTKVKHFKNKEPKKDIDNTKSYKQK